MLDSSDKLTKIPIFQDCLYYEICKSEGIDASSSFDLLEEMAQGYKVRHYKPEPLFIKPLSETKTFTRKKYGAAK